MKRKYPNVFCKICKKCFWAKSCKANKYCSLTCYWKDMYNKRGKDTSGWKNSQKDAAIHKWISRNWVKPDRCEFCFENKKLDWANISGDYIRKKCDWLSLCRKCHNNWDHFSIKLWITRKKENKRPICAIDLDNTLHKYSKGYADGTIYDDPVQDSVESVKKIMEKGYECYVFTAREPEQWREIAFWLYKNGFPGMQITNKKRNYAYYIDDKAFKFENWEQIKSIIKEFL